MAEASTHTGDQVDVLSDSSENTGFAISTRTPRPGAEQQALVSQVVIEFSRAPMAETVSEDTLYLTAADTRVAVDREYASGSNTVTLAPREPLQPNQDYRVHVTDTLMDHQGESFRGTSWAFRTAGNVGSTSQAVIDQCMTDSDIEMLARVNNARATAQSCGERQMAAAKPLAWHCTIETAARVHSSDMAQYDFFSHTGSDGSSAGDRLYNAGYDWQAWAENIAAGQRNVKQVVDELLASPGHCVNIMNANFTQMGAALVENSEAYYRRYWTQNFAKPRTLH